MHHDDDHEDWEDDDAISCFRVVLGEVGLDVHPADGTPLVLSQPLVDALHMEEVHARQPSHVLLRLELREADGALVRLLFLLLSLTSCGCLPLGELVRESVSLNA